MEELRIFIQDEIADCRARMDKEDNPSCRLELYGEIVAYRACLDWIKTKNDLKTTARCPIEIIRAAVKQYNNTITGKFTTKE